MKKATNESVIIARHINAFLNDYVPSQKSRSSHTLKSYHYALALYIGFLETEKGISAERLYGECFSRTIIEEWLHWLMEVRDCWIFPLAIVLRVPRPLGVTKGYLIL